MIEVFCGPINFVNLILVVGKLWPEGQILSPVCFCK